MQRILINLHPNEDIHRRHYYQFAVTLYRCDRSCNTLNNLTNKACVPKKTI